MPWKFMVYLTLILLTWRIWWAPNNSSKWQMGFTSNLAFKGLMTHIMLHSVRWRMEEIHEITQWEESISTLVTESETFHYEAGEQRHIKNISNIVSTWPTIQLANQPTNQPTNQTTNQPTNYLTRYLRYYRKSPSLPKQVHHYGDDYGFVANCQFTVSKKNTTSIFRVKFR